MVPGDIIGMAGGYRMGIFLPAPEAPFPAAQLLRIRLKVSAVMPR